MRPLLQPDRAFRDAMADDHRRVDLLMTVATATVGTALWGWDWVHDASGAVSTIWLRLLIFPTALPYVIALRRQWSLAWTCTAAAGTILGWELGYLAILGRLDNGWFYGNAGFLYFTLMPLLMTRGLPLAFNLALLTVVTAVAFLGTGSPLLVWRYVALLLPAAIMNGIAVCFFARQYRDLYQVTQTGASARLEAEAANRAKTEFLTRMGHELRTPLNAILGFAQLQLRDPRCATIDVVKRYGNQIEHAGWHLLELIDDAVDVAGAETGRFNVRIEQLALAPLVEAAITMVSPLALQRNIRIVVDSATPSAAVMGDARRVRQILLNLLSNAVKYNVEGGRIDISSRAVGAFIEITVADTGIGMSDLQLSQLFRPYNRLGREHLNIEGTGIGLAISRRLAELIGGALDANSQQGRGSDFRLRLAAAPTKAFDAPRGGSAAGKATVAYFEDDPIYVEIVRAGLDEWNHVKLETRAEATNATSWLRQIAPQLILLDLHLKDGSGVVVLRLIKADPRLAHVPVLVVTADARPLVIDEVRRAGAMGTLTKPWDFAQLRTALGSVLDRGIADTAKT